MPVSSDFYGLITRFFSQRYIYMILLLVQVSISYSETILFEFASTDPDPKLENLLYVAAGIELMQSGISSTQKDEQEADYLLSTQYDSAKGKTTVHYRFFARSSPEKILADITFEVTLDPDFDSTVASAVRQVLKLSGIRFTPSPNAKIDGILSVPRITKISDQSPTVHKDTDTPGGQHEKTKINLSGSIAGVFLLGDITKFMHNGISCSLGAGYSWRDETWNIMLGGSIIATRLFNDAEITGGSLYVFYIGPEVLFGTGRAFPYRVAATLSGGAAIISVADSDAMRAKTAPCADAGVSLTIPIGSGFSIGLGVKALFVFDSDMIIAGTSTDIVIGMEL